MVPVSIIAPPQLCTSRPLPDIMTDSPQLEHHSSLYLDDGNVCLTSGLHDSPSPRPVFRVHKSLLARHSSVFKDMFALPATDAGDQDQYEGLPLVVMQDHTNGIEALLLALYDR